MGLARIVDPADNPLGLQKLVQVPHERWCPNRWERRVFLGRVVLGVIFFGIVLGLGSGVDLGRDLTGGRSRFGLDLFGLDRFGRGLLRGWGRRERAVRQIGDRGHGDRLGREDDRVLQFTFVFLQVGFVSRPQSNHLARHFSLRSGGPANCRNQAADAGVRVDDRQARLPPFPPNRDFPGFESDVFEPVFLHLGGGPLIGPFQGLRAGQSGADGVGNVFQVFHHLVVGLHLVHQGLVEFGRSRLPSQPRHGRDIDCTGRAQLGQGQTESRQQEQADQGSYPADPPGGGRRREHVDSKKDKCGVAAYRRPVGKRGGVSILSRGASLGNSTLRVFRWPNPPAPSRQEGEPAT